MIHDSFDWSDDVSITTPLPDSVIYETHVKGFSYRNPDIPDDLRGTYGGIAHPSSIEYFKNLGITAVELLPIHDFIDEGHLVDKGLKDYWGYNTLGCFAPSARYRSCGDPGGQVREVQGDGEGAARSGHRGDSRRWCTTTHAGKPHGSHAELEGRGHRAPITG